MLGDISKAEHIYIAVGYTDMRKQIDGLSALVTTQFRLDPYDYIEFILDYLPQQDLVENPERLDWFLPWSEEIKEEFEIKAD